VHTKKGLRPLERSPSTLPGKTDRPAGR